MLEAILFLVSIVACGLSFYLGIMFEQDREEKRLSARVIRPANIVKKVYHVQEYTVSDEALDLDFPEVEKIR